MTENKRTIPRTRWQYYLQTHVFQVLGRAVRTCSQGSTVSRLLPMTPLSSRGWVLLSKEALRAQEFTCKPTSRHHCTLPWSFSACSQLPPKPSSRRREMKNSQFSSYLRWYRASDRTETIMHLPSFSMQPLTSSPEAEEAMASTPSPDAVGSHPPNVPQSQKGLNPVGTSYP